MNSKRAIISGVLLTIVAVGQIILAIVLYDTEGNTTLINFGWIILMVSSVFGWLPIFTFRKKGKVEGRSYIHTTVLVDSGIYAFVRHPQYLAGVLISVALPMITQHWLVALLGLIGISIYFRDTFDEEERCIKKFGEAYRQYMKRVPRLNFITGIIRTICN